MDRPTRQPTACGAIPPSFIYPKLFYSWQMGLFSTLVTANKDDRDTSGEKSSKTSLPTVIQLYSREPVLLEPDVAASSSLPSYAMLSYSAVPLVNDPLQSPFSTGFRRKQQQLPDPELGVWNVRLGGASQFHLLDRVPATPNSSNANDTFAFTVDLSEPAQVEPAMTLLQNALVRFYKERDGATITGSSTSLNRDPLESKTATTSLFHLQTTHFGLAPQDILATTIEPDIKDKNCKFCLVILAKMPPHSDSSEDQDYRVQQEQALLQYHLYKFACQLQAYLVFVGGDKEPERREGTTSAMIPVSTRQEVAILLRDLAQGIPPAKPVTLAPALSEDDDANVPVAVEQELSIFAPDNAELVESVLLRNASFPGVWDAATTSLWKILVPPAPKTSASAAEKYAAASGDQGWLKELRDSITTVVEKTPVKTTKKEISVTPQQGDDTSSFFASLLGDKKS